MNGSAEEPSGGVPHGTYLRNVQRSRQGARDVAPHAPSRKARELQVACGDVVDQGMTRSRSRLASNGAFTFLSLSK